jgi:hypothetical protein
MLAPSTFRGVLLTVAMIIGGTPTLRDQPDQQTKGRDDETRSLLQENESLEKQYALASGNSFYLMVDPYGAEMTLAHRGVALRRYSILDVRLGVPRVAFIGSNIQRQWAGTIWSGGLLDPQRPSDRVARNGSDARSASAPPSLPPTSETAEPVPMTYVARYEPGLVVEIHRSSPDSDAGWRGLLTKWGTHGREALAALSPSDRKLIHLRIVLTSDDADALYRSLPPETKLLIVGDSRDKRPHVSSP